MQRNLEKFYFTIFITSRGCIDINFNIKINLTKVLSNDQNAMDVAFEMWYFLYKCSEYMTRYFRRHYLCCHNSMDPPFLR